MHYGDYTMFSSDFRVIDVMVIAETGHARVVYILDVLLPCRYAILYCSNSINGSTFPGRLYRHISTHEVHVLTKLSLRVQIFNANHVDTSQEDSVPRHMVFRNISLPQT